MVGDGILCSECPSLELETNYFTGTHPCCTCKILGSIPYHLHEKIGCGYSKDLRYMYDRAHDSLRENINNANQDQISEGKINDLLKNVDDLTNEERRRLIEILTDKKI